MSKERRPGRIVDQFIGSGTAIGANMHEADEAMSRADFIKSLAIALKEANETQYWLKLIIAMDYLPQAKLANIESELNEHKAILKTLIARSRQKA